MLNTPFKEDMDKLRKEVIEKDKYILKLEEENKELKEKLEFERRIHEKESNCNCGRNFI